MRMRGVLQAGAGVSQHKFSKFHAAQCKHTVRYRLQVLASTLHDDDFQAVMAIKMDMRGREDHGACERRRLV